MGYGVGLLWNAGWDIAWDMLRDMHCNMKCLSTDVVLHNNICHMLISNVLSIEHESGALLMM